MLSEVEFRASVFAATDADGGAGGIAAGRGALVPPGRRMALFLRDALREQGEPVGDPQAEDWGWVLPIAHTDFRLWIGVGRVDGAEDRYVCFIEPNRQYVRKLWKKVPTAERVGGLRECLDAVLKQHAAIHDVEWRNRR